MYGIEIIAWCKFAFILDLALYFIMIISVSCQKSIVCVSVALSWFKYAFVFFKFLSV